MQIRSTSNTFTKSVQRKALKICESLTSTLDRLEVKEFLKTQDLKYAESVGKRLKSVLEGGHTSNNVNDTMNNAELVVLEKDTSDSGKDKNNDDGNDNFSKKDSKIVDDDVDNAKIDKICNKYIECVEGRQTSCRQRSWILSSGTNVGDVLAAYAKTIPNAEKFLNPVYWNILDLTGNHFETKCIFSEDDWAEMVASFEQEVKLVKSDISDGVLRFFDELEKASDDRFALTEIDLFLRYQSARLQVVKAQGDDDVVTAIERIFPESINKDGVNLNAKDQDIATIRRAIVTYAENLRFVDLPVSEAAFDNAFTNMLVKRCLDPEELKIDVGEIACWASAERRNVGRSILLRARVGQKCDLRGTMKKSINNFEPLIGLHRIDLSVTLRDIICQFFISNSKAQDDDLHKTFVIGMQSWGWVHEIYAMDCKATNIMRFGRLRQSRLPNTVTTLPCLEEFFVAMSDLMATIKIMREHVNNIALAHSRAHRKRNENQLSEVGGCFGTVPETPVKKVRKNSVEE
ncbi:hypothetical protein BC936DRAFT_148878 [Jimgerdemannia flammicorona]|uniref:Uncharacterized protein n=1 Tax=Jimgerdemannia flammicorona TaxID=994334 RepID=A0A433D247_9FUNG|nr:hypothetical protein BC936DRAFT_148878 [Jimgerdemannia flammicorona]